MTVALMAATTLVAAGVQATTGIGFALVLTPLLLGLFSPEAAIITVTVLGLELNVLVLFAERRRRSVAWAEIGPMLLAAVPGTVGGVVLLQSLSRPALQVTVGALVLVAVAVRVRQRHPAPVAGGWLRCMAIGLTTGALTTSSGISGPPLALWLSRRGLPAAQLRDSLSVSFLVLGALGTVALLPLLSRVHLDPIALLASALGVIGGHRIGSRIFVLLGPERFEPLLLAVISMAGLVSILTGTGIL